MIKNESTKIIIKTESNLLIGGNPTRFEIGSVDQETVVDFEGKPFIPASSFKGAFREIIQREGVNKDKDENGAKEIIRIYETFFKEKMKELRDDEKLENWERVVQEITPLHLFGVEGMNRSPKLLFSDFFLICDESRAGTIEDCFSIDAKNTIVNDQANPRTYKVARRNLNFLGSIDYWGFCSLEEVRIVEKYIKEYLKIFNHGVYRLGNSKSRGYGKIRIEFPT